MPSHTLTCLPFQIAVGILLGVQFNKYNTSDLPTWTIYITLVFICIYVAGYAWSWGPLGWLVPTEVRCAALCVVRGGRGGGGIGVERRLAAV